MTLSGWAIDLRAVYGGALWAQRSRFHLGEMLYELPDGSRAVLLYGIAEVGVNKQVARAAVFADKGAPSLLWASGRELFWFEGCPGEAVVFSPDGRAARLYEYLSSGGRLDCRERSLELETGRLLHHPASRWWERLLGW